MNSKNPNIKIRKQELRKELLHRRRMLDQDFILIQSAKMAEHLFAWPNYQQADRVMLFLSMPDEPSMTKIIEHAWQQGKTVCIPYMREEFGVMDAAIIHTMDDLVRGRLNLLVPNPDHVKLIDPESIDLIVVPAVTYDNAGNRLGMGAGYYDRFIPKARKAVLIGAIWSSQMIDCVPSNQYDKPVHYLLREDGIISCGTGAL